jgi:predicted MFS family arabinose efflux permease
MNGVNLAIGGLLAFGFAHITNASLASWQFMFLALGCITVLWGLYVIYWLPPSPMRARGFSDEDRTKCLERVRENQTGVQNKKFKWPHVKEAFLDPMAWALFLVSILNTIPVGGVGAYMNIIISDNLGFSVLQTDLLSIAQGAILVSFLALFTWLSNKTGQTLFMMIIATIPPVVSAVCFLSVPNTPAHAVGLLIAIYLTQTLHPQMTLILSLISRNVGGQTKRSVVTAMSFIGWAVGNAVGPQLFQAKNAPQYRPAFIAQLGCYVASIVVFALMRMWYMEQNRRKRKACNQARGRPDDA